MRQARRDAAHGDQAIGAPHLVDGGDARLRLALDALLRRGQIGGGLAGGTMAAIPVPPAADLLVGTTAARSAAAGDVWDTRLGFASPLPVVPAGHYTATVTFTVIGR